MVSEDDTVQISKEALEAEATGLDAETLSRLTQARFEALKPATGFKWNKIFPGLTVALACSYMLFMFFFAPANFMESETSDVEVEMALLDGGVELDMLDDLDFIYWMEEESLALIQEAYAG